MTKDITAEHVLNDLRYLTLLARSFPTVADASTEIINLEAILNLPKGTEHFLSDIHGEHQAFNHVLKNASGAIKRKVNEIFSNTLRDFEKKELCTLIYYPEQKLELIRQREKDLDDWYLITLNQLVRVCRNVSSKYTRSKVRKALPKEFSYIIQELLHESSDEPNKSAYVDQIINISVSHTGGNGNAFAFCAGQNADIQAGDVGFGFYFNMRGGLPPCALAVFTNVERAVERAGPVRNDAEQFFSDAVHCFPTSLLGHCVQPAAPSNNPGSTKARGPACCTTPSAMTTISSAMARMRS